MRNNRHKFVFVIIILLNAFFTSQAISASSEEFSSDNSRISCPAFLVRFDNKKSKVFADLAQISENKWRHDDADLAASVEYLDNNYWRLVISNKKTAIKEVRFPWFQNRITLGVDASDDLIYYPYLFGVLHKSDSMPEWGWAGVSYPGAAFSPLMMICDDEEALIVAATNWPPRKVKLLYSKQRINIVYEQLLQPNQSETYKVLIYQVKGQPRKGQYPWHDAVDRYKGWLTKKMTEENLYPVSYPLWMREIDGFIDYQLENNVSFNITAVYEKWNRWNTFFPWIQFWGQMSDYAGFAGGGCCLVKSEMHSRYRPELAVFARNITTYKGFEGHVGYYCRPKDSLGLLSEPNSLDANGNLRFVIDWLNKNKNEYHANAFYIDVLGGRYFGDPLFVAGLFRDVFPPCTFIEYPVDIYPTSFLVSGSLGGWAKNNEYGRSIGDLKKGFKKSVFPRLGRYLLADRIIFLGEENGDHRFWGPKAGYWTERQAFLLGAKFSAIRIADNPHKPDIMNKAMSMAISERKRVSWWQRGPVYLDTKGVYNVPPSVEVRRFIDKTGKNLFVIDNWDGSKGTIFNFEQKTIKIPTRKLSIVVNDSV